MRCFEDDEVVHGDDSVDPVRDLETIQRELCAKDAAYVDSQEAIALKDVKKSQGMKLPIRFYEVRVVKTGATRVAHKRRGV